MNYRNLLCRGLNHYERFAFPELVGKADWSGFCGVARILQLSTAVYIEKAVEINTDSSMIDIMITTSAGRIALVLSDSKPTIDDKTTKAIERASINVLWVCTAFIDMKNVSMCAK